jgi:ABC-type sugar transport system substrate-binding protein
MNNLRIGFLAARLDEPYQHAVWTGAQEEAEQLGATVVFLRVLEKCEYYRVEYS